ncbi:MAG TPA: ATPase, T2SS/T4P/T4SS family, partial [Thermoleophilaceae bacterium]
MSEGDRGPHLYPVPGVGDSADGAAAAAAAEVPEIGNGITPPRHRGRRGRFISDVIVELGFLPKERVDAAVEEARGSGRTPEQVLLESGGLTADQLARATAERFGLDHVDLTIYKPDVGALNLVNVQSARRYNAAPIGFDDGVLLVAMADPSNVLALDDLKLLTKQEIRPVVASAEDIAALISKMNRLDDAVAEAISEDDSEELALVSDIRESADDAPVIKLVNSIIAQAIEEGASDIHFEPDGREMRVRFRVDGVLSESTTIPKRMLSGVISRVKIMANLDIAERRVPQDGRVSLTVEGHGVDVRVVTLPSVHGEGIVMRILDKEQVLLTLDTLGMRDEARERFEAGFKQSYGAVLVT